METDVRTKPFTGAEYLNSLNDEREVWLNGEKVKDVVNHPAFRNSARTVASLYDSLHDPKYKDVLTAPTDSGGGSFTHKFYKASRNVQELKEARDAIAAWSRLTYGWLGRTPDYKGAFLATLGGNSDFYGDYKQNALNWYKKAQEEVRFMSHAIINPPVDRNKPIHEVSDVFVHVEKETDAGIIVSGSKMVATGAALTHTNFVAHLGSLSIEKKDNALVFFLPQDAPGVKHFCRTSYEYNAAKSASPFDYPLSSRFDENDSVLVLDKVFIPWENLLVYRDVEKANNFYHYSGFANLLSLHGCTRFAVKLDFIAGVLAKALETAGTNEFRGVQVNLGEVIAWRNLFWGLSTAMVAEPEKGNGDVVLPNMEYGMAYRVFSTMAWPRVKEIVQNLVAGGLIVQTSNALDFNNEEMRPYLDRFYRGSNGYEAVEKQKVIKLLWDATGTEFGGRHELYERNYSGSFEDVRLHTLFTSKKTGSFSSFVELAEQCMGDYDEHGWKSTWINPDDIFKGL